MANQNDSSDVVAELQKINRLLMTLAMEGKTQNEKILFCSQLGMTHPQIGDAVGISANAVQKTLKRLKEKETETE